MAKKVSSAPKIKYVHGNEIMLDEIRVLWEALNRCMYERTTYFKQHFAGMTFQKRKTELLEKVACGLVHVDLAVDEATGKTVGYLVSSLDSKKKGTVESIFVSEEYRGIGIGDGLMRNALAWMDQNGAETKIVEVTTGNEQTYGFYGRYGFLPRQTLLKQVTKS
jgi:ribosomal protein S18 acetylase RimI-like enzyme